MRPRPPVLLMRPDPRDRSAYFSLLPRSLPPGLRLPRPAGFLSLLRLAALPLTPVLTPLVTLSSLDGTLQLLVLLIADPALTLAALVIKESPVCGELLESCSASS